MGVINNYLTDKVKEEIQNKKHKRGNEHTCMFKKGEVENLRIDPKCTICGASLEEYMKSVE